MRLVTERCMTRQRTVVRDQEEPRNEVVLETRCNIEERF